MLSDLSIDDSSADYVLYGLREHQIISVLKRKLRGVTVAVKAKPYNSRVGPTSTCYST